MPTRSPLFSGLVFDENGQPVEIAWVGDEPHYVVFDAGFRRHVPSEYVDRQVLDWFQEQIAANQELVTEGVLSMLGRDDLFSKAMVDLSVKNLSKLMQHGLPDDARTWLGLLGFRVTVDIHGNVVAISGPVEPSDE